jgi:diaminopimelate decarboxylase
VPQWHGDLAPGQTRDRDGVLALGGISAESLARRYGTPLLAIDLDVVDAAIGRLRQCGDPLGVDISYAAKAFATVGFIRHVARSSIGIDVCSLGELVTAERAGCPSERVTLHGAGKLDEELRAASSGRVGFVVADSIEELRRLAELAREGHGASVVLRLNVGIEAATHAAVRTGGADTKFGIHPRDEASATALLRTHRQLRFAGLHAHIGSQIDQTASYLAVADALIEAAERFARAGILSERIIIGGGFSVAAAPEAGETLDVCATIAAAAERVRSGAVERRLAVPRLGIEPGRAIVALAGTTLYRVLAVKRQSDRTFVVVDGGVAENPRPALYGAHHHVLPVRKSEHGEAPVTLCGRSCENDELASARLPVSIRRGDLVAMCGTGAYTYSMAGNYNRFPRPAVAGISGGSPQLLARRESLDDVLRNDVDEPPEDESAGSRPAF